MGVDAAMRGICREKEEFGCKIEREGLGIWGRLVTVRKRGESPYSREGQTKRGRASILSLAPHPDLTQTD
jgi:hypothetical protein